MAPPPFTCNSKLRPAPVTAARCHHTVKATPNFCRAGTASLSCTLQNGFKKIPLIQTVSVETVLCRYTIPAL